MIENAYFKETVNTKICQIHCITQLMTASAALKQIQYPLWSWWPELLSWNKETLYSRKNYSLRLNTANYKKKMFLKSDSHLPKKCVISFIESLLKIMKNAFYFISKALLVLNTFKFLSWPFVHVEKTAWFERSA